MKIERFPAGPLDTNGYLVSDSGHAVIIDPSLEPVQLIRAITSANVVIDAILLTHAHFDHFLGIDALQKTIGLRPIYLHPADYSILTDPHRNGASWISWTKPTNYETTPYNEGENRVGDFIFSAIFTPGHTPGGVSLLFGNDCFTGDTLFNGAVGRSDFGYSNTADLFRSIEEKLLTLPESTVIWPGHGASSTIGAEIRQNPYLQ